MPTTTEPQWALLSEKLGAKARSFIWPGKRIYTQSDNKLIVPSDLLAHPFAFLCGDQAPEKATLAQLECDYPVGQIVKVTQTGLQVFPLCDTPPLSEAELRRRFTTPVDDAIRIQLLQQWSTCKLPLCTIRIICLVR
jgi:hypothetical protein